MTPEETAAEHVEQWFQDGVYPLVHSERLTHYLSNLLKQERREGRLEAAERVMDRCECWDEESQECQWCMVAREIRAQ